MSSEQQESIVSPRDNTGLPWKLWSAGRGKIQIYRIYRFAANEERIGLHKEKHILGHSLQIFTPSCD